MKEIKYTCRHCGETNVITTFWKWFFTPHIGSRKWIKCKECEKRSYMNRQNWNKLLWFDRWR